MNVVVSVIGGGGRGNTVQALRELRAEKDAKISALEKSNAEMQQRLAALEKTVAHLANQSSPTLAVNQDDSK